MIKDIAEHNATVKSNTKELQILKQYFPSCFPVKKNSTLRRSATG